MEYYRYLSICWVITFLLGLFFPNYPNEDSGNITRRLFNTMSLIYLSLLVFERFIK